MEGLKDFLELHRQSKADQVAAGCDCTEQEVRLSVIQVREDIALLIFMLGQSNIGFKLMISNILLGLILLTLVLK